MRYIFFATLIIPGVVCSYILFQRSIVLGDDRFQFMDQLKQMLDVILLHFLRKSRKISSLKFVIITKAKRKQQNGD